MAGKLIIKGANENNLKHMNVTIENVSLLPGHTMSVSGIPFNINWPEKIDEKITPNCVMSAFIQVDSMLIEYCMPGTFTRV